MMTLSHNLFFKLLITVRVAFWIGKEGLGVSILLKEPRVFTKFDQFLPVRSHFDTKRPVNFFHIPTFPSPTFGPLFAFHCPLFFTKYNNLHAAMF